MAGTVFDARPRSSLPPDQHLSPTVRWSTRHSAPRGLYASTEHLSWRVVTPFATLGLGTGTSPVLFENLVIIQRDEDNGGWVAYRQENR